MHWGSGIARRAGLPVLGMTLVVFGAESVAQVDEIIVTTRKREENLQQVPVAVEAIRAEEIQRQGIVTLDDLMQVSSSVILDQGFSPQDQRITIRGLSPTRGRQNVAVLQDGIDISSEAGAGTAGGSLLINPRLFDLERVEIVKGPQNALYGRSAFAGAINYITRKPGDVFEGRVGTDIGSDGQLEFSGMVSGPVSDTLSLGLTAMAWTHDGFYTNSITGNDMGDTEGTSVAGTFVWRPSEALSITGRVENLNDEFGITPYAIMPFNAQFAIPASAQVDSTGLGPVVDPSTTSVAGVRGKVPDGDSLVPISSEDPRTCRDPDQPATPGNNCGDYGGTDRDISRATLTVDYDLGPVLLTSLTHYATTETFQDEGAPDVSAGSSPTPREAKFLNETDLFSQELRLSSNNNGAIRWTVGALYWDEASDFLDGSFTCLNYTDAFIGFPNGPQPCGPYLADIGSSVPLNADRWTRDTEHWSVYGLVEWQFLDAWSIAFEARQTWEDLAVTGPDQDNGIFDPSGNLCLFFGMAQPCPQIGPGTFAPGVFGPDAVTIVADARGGDTDDQFFAPKATLTWTPTADQLYYFSLARAYKPKGISMLLGGTGAFYDSGCGGAANPDCVDPIAGFRFDQEKLDVYELGGKTSWLDRHIRLNGALFYQDFKNKQVSTQLADPNTGILSPRTVNAGEAEVWGLELEMSWLATDNITLNLGYTFLDTEYTNFESFTTGVGAIAYAGNCRQEVRAGRVGCVVSYNGNELEDAPKHALTGSARYQDTLVGSTSWFVEGAFQYQDDRYEGNDNQLVMPSYWNADFRIGLVSNRWDFIAYVDNAFDDDTVRTGFGDGDIPTFYATNVFLNRGTVILPDPRTYGLRVSYRFGNL